MQKDMDWTLTILELSESEKSIPGSKGLLGFYILTSNKVKHLFGVKTNPVHQ